MPYEIDWEPQGVVWRYRGEVTGDELLESNQEIYGDARFDRMDYQIVDLTDVKNFSVTADDMQMIAAVDRAAALTNPKVRVAVIANDGTTRSLSELYDAQIADAPWEQQIFESIDEARDWLSSSAR